MSSIGTEPGGTNRGESVLIFIIINRFRGHDSTPRRLLSATEAILLILEVKRHEMEQDCKLKMQFAFKV